MALSTGIFSAAPTYADRPCAPLSAVQNAAAVEPVSGSSLGWVSRTREVPGDPAAAPGSGAENPAAAPAAGRPEMGKKMGVTQMKTRVEYCGE
jgi:hypothetical protein